VIDDAPDQGAFRGNLYLPGALDPFLLQILVPLSVIGKNPGQIRSQKLVESSRQFLRLPVGHGVIIDDVIRASCSKQFQKVDPTLGGRGFKPGKPQVANVSAVAVLTLMTRSRIINA
jgi:hypothetical protein